MKPGRSRDGRCGPGSERGATLVIALVMLSLMLIQGIASFTAANIQVRNAGSLQSRQEAQAAADLGVADVLNSAAFVADPDAVARSPIDIDIDGNGRAAYRVSVTPACIAVQKVTLSMLVPERTDDAACIASSTVDGDTACVDTSWNLQAVAIPAPGATDSGVRVEMHQGVRVRLDAGDAARVCPGVGIAGSTPPVSLTKMRRKTYWYLRT